MPVTSILFIVLIVTFLGALLATILYIVAQKFKVYEDPRIGQVEQVLPGANCGGCGYAGCRAFSEACVKADNMDNLFCPVGGNDCMTSVANVLGRTATAKAPEIAVLRCNGSCEHRPRINVYDGAKNCRIAAGLYAGETGCSFGCYGFGDCCVVCDFDAIAMNPVTLLPEVDEDKCTACGACVKACPKFLLELRKKGPKSRRIYVSCRNEDKGGTAKKACSVACTGCTLCQKECKFEAITINNYLAYIDDKKCTLCRKCVSVCPTQAIQELNFPLKKVTATEVE